MDNDQASDPAAIEQDVERTQDAIGDTIGKIEDRLSSRGLAQSLLGDNNADAAREAWVVVRESPLPVALILGGAAWLLATSKAPIVSRLRNELKSRLTDAFGTTQTSSSPGSQDGSSAVRPPAAIGEAFDRRPS